MRLFSLIRKNWVLFAILALALFLRVYNIQEYFMYSHDQDLAGWIIKDILVNGHLRLIGQETSSQGVFIGPLFYYLQIPFYLLSSMDPIGGTFLSVILGIFSVFSFYWVFAKIFNKKVGLVASAIYAFSYVIVFADREVAPTMPVMLWTVWYFYGLWGILKGKGRAFILLGILLGLVWNLNLALLLLTPLIPLGQILSKKKLDIKMAIIGSVALLLVASPFFIFEKRHGFMQTNSIASSLTTSKDYEGGSKPGLAKLDRVMQITYANTTRLFWGQSYLPGLVKFTFWGLVSLFVYLIYRKALSRETAILIFFWQVLYILFFTINSINISEYYLNGMNVVWIALISLGVTHFAGQKNVLKYLSLVVLFFLVLNLRSFYLFYTNGNGYLEKKALISFIKKDAGARGYPCVSISYITAPGYQFGFRYLYWLEGLKIKSPLSGSPVYSIVFPLSYVDSFDERFGGLGLVLPDYERYTEKSVEKACEGDNENLTVPMFGYTQ